MPQPQNILSGIHIAIFDIATERANVCTDRQAFLDNLATLVTLLRGETRIDSYHVMTSSCSLVLQDIEKHSPGDIANGFGKVMVLDHMVDTQLLDNNQMIAFSYRLGRLEVRVGTILFIECDKKLIGLVARPF